MIEARPAVQIIYALRFLAAFELAGGPARMAAGRRLLEMWWLPVALFTWLCASTVAYLFDGVMDVVEDRLNGSKRPIASGQLPRPVAAALAAVFSVLALLGAVVLGGPWPYLVSVMLALGFAYSAPPVRLKRYTWACGTTVIVAGLLTFAAGGSADGHLPHHWPLAVFAIAMSSWMGLVGAVAKDFSDVFGDAVAGRRTLVVVRGTSHTARRLSGNAFFVAITFFVAALWVAPALVWPAVAVAFGAAAVALTSLHRPEGAPRRRPYRAFMVTQYVAHVVVLMVAVV
jgi:4-hydroxybenzoate polyprenyltransferase